MKCGDFLFQISCGGCHTLVLAKINKKSSTDGDTDEINESPKHSAGINTLSQKTGRPLHEVKYIKNKTYLFRKEDTIIQLMSKE